MKKSSGTSRTPMATARRPGRQHLGFFLAAVFLVVVLSCKREPTRHNETAGLLA